MIINTFTLISLFSSVIFLVIASVAAVSTIVILSRVKGTVTPDRRLEVDRQIYLVLLLAATGLTLRLFSWPVFYIMLQSLIPLIQGAMCIFGVTQVDFSLTKFLELMKFVVFFSIGAWLILFSLDMTSKSHTLMRRNLRFFLVVSVVAAIEAVAEVYLVLTLSPPGIPVSCCTGIFDIEGAYTLILPVAVLGGEDSAILTTLYHGANLSLCGGILFFIRHSKQKESSHYSRNGLAVLALTGLVNSCITYVAVVDVIAPRLMDLPDHHCVYCLLQYNPQSILILGLLVIGTVFLGWSLLLSFVGAVHETTKTLPAYIGAMLKVSLGCLTASWTWTSFFLLLPGDL